MSNTWLEYVEKTKNKPPRPLLVKAVSLVKEKNEALDLGAGALNDVRFLVLEGFNHVTAVDQKAVAADIAANFPENKLSYVINTFEDFDFKPETYDLINAQYALPFNPKLSFDVVFERVISSLKPGGVFVGNLFGDKDGWNTPESRLTFHTRAEAEKLLAPLQIVQFIEEEKDDKTASGDIKHWHVWHFIARK